MNNNEFLIEALAYCDCPEDFEERYMFFETYQGLAIKTLKEVAEVFKKNDITYTLLFGSLLGAIRDGGQIPWDYDVDLGIPYFEKERMYEVLDKYLGEDFFFCAPERDKHYRPSFVRVVPKGYQHQAIHVDIFFIIGLPDDKKERDEYCEQLRESVKARKYIAENLSEYPYKLKTKLYYTMLKYKYIAKYGSVAVRDRGELYSRYDVRNVKEVTHLSVNSGKITDSACRYLEPIPYITRDGTFLVPKEYEMYLEERFGEWKKYPPIQDRIGEVMKHCGVFEWYKRQANK